jgi:hypothetical protein
MGITKPSEALSKIQDVACSKCNPSVTGGKVSGKHVTQGFSPDSSALKGGVTDYSIIDPSMTEGLLSKPFLS